MKSRHSVHGRSDPNITLLSFPRSDASLSDPGAGHAARQVEQANTATGEVPPLSPLSLHPPHCSRAEAVLLISAHPFRPPLPASLLLREQRNCSGCRLSEGYRSLKYHNLVRPKPQPACLHSSRLTLARKALTLLIKQVHFLSVQHKA